MFFAIGIFTALGLSFLLATKKDKDASDWVLCAWLLIIAMHLGLYYEQAFGELERFPFLVLFKPNLPLLHGPFLIWFITLKTKRGIAWNPGYILHLIPFCVFLPYLLITYHFFGKHDFNAYLEWLGRQAMIKYGLVSCVKASGLLYVIWAIAILWRWRHREGQRFSAVDQLYFRWLLRLCYTLAIPWAVILFGLPDTMIYGAVVLYLLFLAYSGIKQVGIFTDLLPPFNTFSHPIPSYPLLKPAFDVLNEKYQRSGLSNAHMELIHAGLREQIETNKVYLDENLSLDGLANALKVSPNHLSQVINQLEGKNFHDYVNEKRTEAFIARLNRPESRQYTLLALAYDCGFNSKASFYRHFKKHTGLTPSEYMHQNKSHPS
jgi:AraC-like DNA-binding protein